MKRAPSFKLFLILTAVSVALGSFVVYMQYSSLGDEQAKRDQLKSEIKNDVELKKLLADSADRLKGTRERLAHLERGVPDYAYLATMLKDLEVTGRKNGVQILGVNSKIRPKATPVEGEKEERKPYIEQDIEVAGRGSFKDILNFVRALNSFPKIVETRCVTVQPKSKNDGTAGLDMTIEIRAFLFPDKQKTPDPKTAMRVGDRHES